MTSLSSHYRIVEACKVLDLPGIARHDKFVENNHRQC